MPPGFYNATGPGFLPMWVGVALIAFSVPLLIRPTPGSRPLRDFLPHGEGGRRALMVLAALVAYTLVLDWVGFLIASFLLILALLQMVERGRWPAAVAISLVAVIATYWLFVKFLGLILPGGLLAV
jgi:putative tricarboxylic transport membrane protein